MTDVQLLTDRDIERSIFGEQLTASPVGNVANFAERMFEPHLRSGRIVSAGGVDFLWKVSGLLPDWIEDVLDELAQLLELPPGWDSYQAPQIRPDTICSAVQLIVNDMAIPDLPRPYVVPTVLGGVQLEWHREDAALEIEFVNALRTEVLWEDFRTGEVVETTLSADYSHLRAWLAQLR